MKLIDQLEKRFGKYGIPNLGIWIMIGQIFVYAMAHFTSFPVESLLLVGGRVLQGEVWRIVSFIFVPPGFGPIGLLFFWYIFFLLSNALIQQWGDFRYTVFIGIGVFFSVLGSFLVPQFPIESLHLLLTITIAFAVLYPDYEFMLYFVLPVKVKWIALIQMIYWAYIILFNPIWEKLTVIAAVTNLFVFFGKDLFSMFKNAQRQSSYKKQNQELDDEPFHTCSACDATDKSHPDRQFFYADGVGFCENCQDKMPD